MKTVLKLCPFLIFFGSCVTGCTRGSSQWFENANPQTSIKVAYEPLSQTYSVDAFSNDGRAIHADELHAKSGDKEFTAKNLHVTERSVENRQANVAQIEASGQAVANVATANWTGFTEAIKAAAPIAAPYLQGMAAAKLAKAQRPGLIEQLSGLVVAGQTSPQALKEIDVPPDIIAEVNRIVDMKLAAMRATTQPSQ